MKGKGQADAGPSGQKNSPQLTMVRDGSTELRDGEGESQEFGAWTAF